MKTKKEISSKKYQKLINFKLNDFINENPIMDDLKIGDLETYIELLFENYKITNLKEFIYYDKLYRDIFFDFNDCEMFFNIEPKKYQKLNKYIPFILKDLKLYSLNNFKYKYGSTILDYSYGLFCWNPCDDIFYLDLEDYIISNEELYELDDETLKEIDCLNEELEEILRKNIDGNDDMSYLIDQFIESLELNKE